MDTPDEQWWDAQAGEFVLGTLRGAERDVFQKILATDSDVQCRVEYWQQRFAHLDEQIESVLPPDYILPLIIERVRNGDRHDAAPVANNTASSTGSDTASQQAPSTPASKVVDTANAAPEHSSNVEVMPQREERSHKRSRSSRRAIRTWKTVSAFAVAATVALAALLVQTLNQPIPVTDTSLKVVSVVQSEEMDALWVLTTQSDSAVSQAVALAPPPIDSTQSYQLWMVKPDNAGVSSVGLLPLNVGETRQLTLPIPPRQAQLFAVSLEPAGGSPDPAPTGPVLFTGAITAVSDNLENSD